jgi:hypothetical protein
MKTTPYFDGFARFKHPEVQPDWIERVLAAPLRTQTQADGRIRHWARIPEFGNRALRVVTEPDGETMHNAFFDRDFKETP